MTDQPKLKRSISLPLLIAYGVGTMVGGGFYALIGRMAGHAGMHVPMSVIVAAVIAMFTALSFCELSSRFPVSAGESRYVDEAFGRKWLSTLVGWGVIATGVVSAATLSRAFVHFWQDLFPATPTAVGIALLVIVLTGIALYGILESVLLAGLITLIEVGGLIWVIVSRYEAFGTFGDRLPELMPAFAWHDWSGIFIAAFLAFYAFIGFEDMVNEAEEVKEPRRNLPRGILLALLITTVLYVVIALVAVLAVTPQELSESNTPLALLVADQGEAARVMMVVISMLAGVNGALVQIVMSSRVAYGLADQGMAPSFLGVVHPRFRTPIAATLLMSTIVLVLALWLPVELLARITSAIMLVNFTLVNGALVWLKIRQVEAPEGSVQYPIIVPILGALMCAAFLGIQLLAPPG
ncbi:MAG: APC family permease [Pirellulaceae bacterium]